MQRQRAFLKQGIRDFFSHRDYLEVETPIGVRCPGTEVHLGFFETEWKDHRDVVHPLTLRTSPELHMKRLLVEGYPRIFQMGPVFRNHGEHADWHHPEFSMLEWYQTQISFDDFVSQTEELLRFTHEKFHKQGMTAWDFPRKVSYLSVSECFERFVGVNLVDQDVQLAQKAKKAGVISISQEDDFETAFFKSMLEKVEPELKKMGVVVVGDYPCSQAALSRVEGGVAKRFEFYVNGVELSNGFWELLDPQENRKRFLSANDERERLGYPLLPLDEDFLADMERGMPDACGNALGVDRWLALLTGKTVAEVVPFRLDYGLQT